MVFFASFSPWQVYNILKLYQNVLFGNIAYVAKYAFYLLNATLVNNRLEELSEAYNYHFMDC